MTKPITKAARIEALSHAYMILGSMRETPEEPFDLANAMQVLLAADPLAPFCDWLLDEMHGAARQEELRKVIAGEGHIRIDPECDEDGNELQECEACSNKFILEDMHSSEDSGWYCKSCVAAYQESETASPTEGE